MRTRTEQIKMISDSLVKDIELIPLRGVLLHLPGLL